jgi:Rrf2 family protein
MKLTRATCYALHALAYMAAQKDHRTPVASHMIAQEKGIPERFLLKVLKPLVDRGVLDSVKGPRGGYKLARPASDITVLEIIEGSENRPIIGKAEPPQPKPDDLRDFPNFRPENVSLVHNKLNVMCKQAADTVRKQFAKVKLSDLIKK